MAICVIASLLCEGEDSSPKRLKSFTFIEDHGFVIYTKMFLVCCILSPTLNGNHTEDEFLLHLYLEMGTKYQACTLKNGSHQGRGISVGELECRRGQHEIRSEIPFFSVLEIILLVQMR